MWWQNQLVVFIILTWSLIWKGLALWKSARNNQRYWFIAILILNTVGLLEIIYLFKFAKHPLTLAEIQGWLQRKPHHKTT